MSFHNLFIVLALTFITNYSYSQPLPRSKQTNYVLHAGSLSIHANITFAPKKDDYIKNLAFFCRQERKLEKALKVPIRLRIGSLDQCNRLEGKK